LGGGEVYHDGWYSVLCDAGIITSSNITNYTYLNRHGFQLIYLFWPIGNNASTYLKKLILLSMFINTINKFYVIIVTYLAIVYILFIQIAEPLHGVLPNEGLFFPSMLHNNNNIVDIAGKKNPR